MQEASKTIYAGLQELHKHIAREPCAILLMNSLEQSARGIYEYFLREQPDERPLLERALDKALERTIELEERILDVEHELRRVESIANAERKRRAELQEELQQLQQNATELESINSENAESAKAWRDRCIVAENQASALEETLGGQLKRVLQDNSRIKRQLGAAEAKARESDNKVDETSRNAAERIEQAKSETMRAIERLECENAELAAKVAKLSGLLADRHPDPEHTKEPQVAIVRSNQPAVEKEPSNVKYTPGKFVKDTLESSDSSQFVEDINEAMERMRNEQLFVQEELHAPNAERVDAGLALINERLKRIGGVYGNTTSESQV